MAQQPEKIQRPAINIYTHSKITDRQLTPLLHGIEEEGVPYSIVKSDELNPLDLAYEAARSSRLGIGIGVSLDYAVITLDKLDKQHPYIAVFFDHNPDLDRITGSDAARIVKRVPLRGHQL